MSRLPTTAEEFYRLRDDRTDRCVDRSGYQRVHCAVFVSNLVASNPVEQTMLFVATNLLSRWCRRVTIVCDASAIDTAIHGACGMGVGALGQAVLAQMRDADPFGDFTITVDRTCRADIELHIGTSASAAGGVPVFVNASGWLMSLSRDRAIQLPTDNHRNRLGGIAAACFGVAQMFKIAIGVQTDLWLRDGVFDLFRLSWSQDNRQGPWPLALAVGEILMVGAGSVGSSAAYCARLSGLSGSIETVDRDTVKVENLNRSPVFGKSNLGLSKAEAVARFLAGSNLRATAVPAWWDEYITGRPRSSFKFDVWLPLANEFGVRLAMQHSVPPLMIHASTTSNWGVNHARHLPGRDDCLADRFPGDTPALDLACSTGQVKIDEASVDAALPFASLFAGLLIVAELVRLQLSDYPHIPNFALLDWYGSLDVIQAWNRIPRDGCICRDQGRTFHDLLNGETKYRALFNFD